MFVRIIFAVQRIAFHHFGGNTNSDISSEHQHSDWEGIRGVKASIFKGSLLPDGFNFRNRLILFVQWAGIDGNDQAGPGLSKLARGIHFPY